MEGKITWSDVFSELWNGIINGEGAFRFLRMLLVLSLLGGTVWSGFMFKHLVDATRPTSIKFAPSSSLAERDALRLNKMIDSFRVAILSRSGSSSLATKAANTARRPFVPSVLLPGPGEDLVIQASHIAPGESEVFKVAEEILPPFMLVRAVLRMSGAVAAVMDIDGEGEGLVVRRGFLFGEGMGRILSISSSKVSILWDGKKISLPVDM